VQGPADARRMKDRWQDTAESRISASHRSQASIARPPPPAAAAAAAPPPQQPAAPDSQSQPGSRRPGIAQPPACRQRAASVARATRPRYSSSRPPAYRSSGWPPSSRPAAGQERGAAARQRTHAHCLKRQAPALEVRVAVQWRRPPSTARHCLRHQRRVGGVPLASSEPRVVAAQHSVGCMRRRLFINLVPLKAPL
jgi:hypothetical protein